MKSTNYDDHWVALSLLRNGIRMTKLLHHDTDNDYNPTMYLLPMMTLPTTKANAVGLPPHVLLLMVILLPSRKRQINRSIQHLGFVLLIDTKGMPRG